VLSGMFHSVTRRLHTLCLVMHLKLQQRVADMTCRAVLLQPYLGLLLYPRCSQPLLLLLLMHSRLT